MCIRDRISSERSLYKSTCLYVSGPPAVINGFMESEFTRVVSSKVAFSKTSRNFIAATLNYISKLKLSVAYFIVSKPV